MTEQEYRRKDSELIQQINEYQIDSAEHQLQIAMNQKQMALLEVNRMDLYNQYIMYLNLRKEICKAK